MTSRRDFLKKAGLLSAAFAVPALNVNGDTPQSKIHLKNTKIAKEKLGLVNENEIILKAK